MSSIADYGSRVIPLTRRAIATVGATVSILAGLLFGIVFRHHLVVATIVGLAICLVLLTILNLLLRWLVSKQETTAEPLLLPIKVTEGTPFTPPHGSAGSKFLIVATAATLAAVAAPFVVASGQQMANAPLPHGPSQTFADEFHRRLNLSLGYVDPDLHDPKDTEQSG